MKTLVVFGALLAVVWLAWAEQTPPAKQQTTSKKQTPAKKPAAKTATIAKKRPAGTSAKKSPSTATASKTAASKNGKKAPAKRATTWRNRQTVPTADRYRQIQDALVSKGYLNSEEANGTWNQSSMDALKKFQTEQNLDPSGKINSLSLIALGLGPKHDTPLTQPPKPPQQ